MWDAQWSSLNGIQIVQFSANQTDEPIETFSRQLSRIAWEYVALDDRAAFDASLRSSGLSEQLVAEALAVRDLGEVEMSDAVERLKPYENVIFLESPPGKADRTSPAGEAFWGPGRLGIHNGPGGGAAGSYPQSWVGRLRGVAGYMTRIEC